MRVDQLLRSLLETYCYHLSSWWTQARTSLLWNAAQEVGGAIVQWQPHYTPIAAANAGTMEFEGFLNAVIWLGGHLYSGTFYVAKEGQVVGDGNCHMLLGNDTVAQIGEFTVNYDACRDGFMVFGL